MKRIVINRFMLGFSIVVVLCGLFWAYLLLFSGEVRQRAVSPDGKLVAESRIDGSFAGATDAAIASVELRTKFNPFRHSVLVALDYGGSVSVYWEDPRHLVVTCERCKNLDIRRKQREWHGVSITYKGD